MHAPHANPKYVCPPFQATFGCIQVYVPQVISSNPKIKIVVGQMEMENIATKEDKFGVIWWRCPKRKTTRKRRNSSKEHQQKEGVRRSQHACYNSLIMAFDNFIVQDLRAGEESSGISNKQVSQALEATLNSS